MTPDTSVQQQMRVRATEAVRIALEQYGVQLDYSEGSIEQVEHILSLLYKQAKGGILKSLLRQKMLSDEDIQQFAMIWGAYIGEVMCQFWGGEWTWEDRVTPEPIEAIQVGEAKCFPQAKVYKRLVNGPEDDVWFYFQALRARYLPREDHRI